jgi:hypothetical protein
MQQKRNLQDVLRQYPAERDELIGLLRLSVELSRLGAPAPDPAFRLRARNLMLARAAQRRRSAWRNPLGWLPRPALRVATAAAFAVALLVGGISAAVASNQSLPGDPLYSVKLGVERVQLAATFDSSARARLELHFADVRLEEAQRLFAVGRKDEGVRLVAQYDAAVAQFNHAVASTALDDRSIGELNRFLAERQAHADASLGALAGSLSARGDAETAAIVARTQSRVDLAFRGTKQDLQRNQATGQQSSHEPKPAGGEH